MMRSSPCGDGAFRDQLPSLFQIHSKHGQLGVVPFDSKHVVTIVSIRLQNCDDGPIGDFQDVLGISVLSDRTSGSSETIRASNHFITSFPDFRRVADWFSVKSHHQICLFASTVTPRRGVVYAGNP
jgi:hypothetical protein